MKISSWLIVSLALGAFFLNPIRAEDEEATEKESADVQVEDEDAYEYDIDAHEIATKVLFPKYSEKSMPVGKEVTLLVDFANNGDDVFNISKVGGHLHSPFDLSYYIQNFTVKEVSGVAAPKAHISLEYKFTADARLEPEEFWLSAWVEYTEAESDVPHRVTIINGTLTLYETGSGFDFPTVMTYVMMLALLAGGAYLASQTSAGKGVLKQQKKYNAPSKEEIESSWDVSTYKPSAKAKKAGRKKVSKK